MAVVESTENFQIGRVVGRTFDALGHNLITFLSLGLLVQLPILLLLLFYPQFPPGPAAPGQLWQRFGPIAAAFIASVVCRFVVQAGLVEGTVTWLNDGRSTFADCLRTGFRYFFSLFLIMILFYLGMMLGFILLIVPGVMLGLAWSVVVPVRVIEKSGISESFGRSRALTKGHRWSILGLVLMYVIVASLIQFALLPLFGISFLAINSVQNVPFQLLRWIVEVATSTIGAVGVASLYVELRLVKEGALPSQLVSAFD